MQGEVSLLEEMEGGINIEKVSGVGSRVDAVCDWLTGRIYAVG